MGLNPADPGQRTTLLDKVNTAAKELYEYCDMAGCYEEEMFKVNGNQTVGFPDYMGNIRAMREGYSKLAINLSQMRPRYNQFNWKDAWRTWRQKGLHPLQTSLTNQSCLVLKVAAVENPPIQVQVSGPSPGSSMASETVIMTSTTMQTVNTYLDVAALTKSAVSQYDVIVSDIDGNQISYIPNNKVKALFQIMDISEAPWYYPNTSPLLGWVEVLYKKALPWFQNDTDEFPAPGYDDIIVYKCLQSWREDQQDIQGAIGWQQKATSVLAQIHENANRGTNDCVSLVANPHDAILNRTGFGRDYYFAYRITGR